MSGRFHRAARDGYLQALKEATKRDCNQLDEDGLTPTLCAAYEGKLDALKLLLIRGGDPEKCDHYGNSSLHCAAARGHLNCVSYLVNFGVNVWALDNEYHSAKDLAALNNKQEILRYLDLEAARQEEENPKRAQKLQEKAKREAEKRQKEYDKIKRKADKKRQEEEEKLQKEREKINNLENTNRGSEKKSIFNSLSKTSLPLVSTMKTEPKIIHSKSVTSSAKFSELTQSTHSNNKTTLGGIQRKLLRKKMNSENKTFNGFKVCTMETDGKKSTRNLSGLQRDSEIIFVPSGSMSSAESGSPTCVRRGKISDVFETDVKSSSLGFRLVRAKSEPDFGESHYISRQPSIFDRPGFGSVAFRNSLMTTVTSISNRPKHRDHPKVFEEPRDASLDSHGSPQGSSLTPWEEEDLLSEEEEEESPIFVFLSSSGLESYMPVFAKEQIDLEALMLLNDQDLESLKLPLGPRRKLLRALNDRRLALHDPGEVTDVKL